MVEVAPVSLTYKFDSISKAIEKRSLIDQMYHVPLTLFIGNTTGSIQLDFSSTFVLQRIQNFFHRRHCSVYEP